MTYPKKYTMNKSENIFWAKRNIVDYIYKSAKLEGLNVTYPDTYAILEKTKAKNVDVEAVEIILNLKHAWRVLLDSIDDELNIDFFKKIHKEVARGEAIAWGSLRTGEVTIGGTEYRPSIPDEQIAQEKLLELLEIKEPTERAMSVMLWAIKGQLFWDGNKRTATLIANKIMIENGCGIISIPTDELDEFHKLLSDYYTNDTIESVKKFIYDKCINGTDFVKNS